MTPVSDSPAHPRARMRGALLCAAFASLSLAALPAQTAYAAGGATASPAATTGGDARGASDGVTVGIAEAFTLRLTRPATTVFIADPSIADVQVPNSTTVIVFGKKAGTTRAYAFNGSKQIASYAVHVVRPVGDIERALKEAVPGASVDVTGTPSGIVVDGQVATPEEAHTLKSVSDQYLGEKDKNAFNVKVGSSAQVNLRVRVAEVSRSVEKQFGFNWDALFNDGSFAIGLLTGRPVSSAFGSFNRDTSLNSLDTLGIGYTNGGSVNISALLDALQGEGLVSILAEPNLTTVSGEPASFLAGGEFPVPVSQSLQQITIEWKRFGVSVDFTPVVLSPDRISIKVKPEVSELSDQGAVTINSIKVPSLRVRRAETTVELASGQSFAIAGLFQNNVNNNVKNFPWLGDVPVLGALFRSSSFQRNESELVIVVTPYIVKPAASASALHMPTDNIVYASDLEQILMGRVTGTAGTVTTPEPVTPGAPHLNGPAGFIME